MKHPILVLLALCLFLSLCLAGCKAGPELAQSETAVSLQVGALYQAPGAGWETLEEGTAGEGAS